MATQKTQTKQPDLILSNDDKKSLNDDKKSLNCEDRKICNYCKFFTYRQLSNIAKCEKGEQILKVNFNNRPIFLCKNKLCKD